MKKIMDEINSIACQYRLEAIYAFGSRAEEAACIADGRERGISQDGSDLDIGIKPKQRLTIDEKVNIASSFEDIFNVPKVDLVIIPDAPALLANEIVTGELLYAEDSSGEAEYQLYIMRRAAELIPYEKTKEKIMLGV